MSGMSPARGGRVRWAIAAVVAALLLVAAVVLLWPRGSSGEPTAAATPTHAHGSTTDAVSLDRVDGDLAVDLARAEPVVPPAQESAGNEPQASLDAAASVDGRRSGTDDLGEPRDPVDPADVVDPDTALGGCHPAYGDAGQCLPFYPPSAAEHVAQMQDAGIDPSTMSMPWTCDEVATFFPDGLTVREPGVDPDGLDSDSDGTACEPEG